MIGWREWIALPGLGIDRIKVKIDTGARSASLHAYDIQRFRRKGVRMVRFRVHPIQRDFRTVVDAEAELIGERKVRSSTGIQTLRPVITTEMELMGRRRVIEVTLTRRDTMGFRMLLGRQAVQGHFLVDPARSYLAASPQAEGPNFVEHA